MSSLTSAAATAVVVSHAQVDDHGVVSVEGEGVVRSDDGAMRYTATSVIVANPAAAGKVHASISYVFLGRGTSGLGFE